METKLILEAARGTLDGTLSFPEVVSKLLAAGVEYYHVDYVGLRKWFYSAEGEMVATSINYEGLPTVAPEFDAAALRANILDSQRNGQKYREFTRRAMAGGVQGYIAFLRGKRVTYWGRTGDQHTEWFPGVGRGVSNGDSLHDAKRRLALVYIGMATDKFSDADTEIFSLLSKEHALKDEIERAQKNN